MPPLLSVLPSSGKGRLDVFSFLRKPYLLALFVFGALPLTIEAAESEWLDQSENAQPEPSPYILYWGGVEGRFTYVESQGAYSAALNLSPEAVWEAIKREPRLWNGETLQETLTLEVSGISVSSDYTRPEVYQECLKPLQGVVKILKEGDRMVIEKIYLPDGKYGSVTLLIGPSEFKPKQEAKRYGVAAVHWGKNKFAQGEKRFMTTAEFWDMLLSEPQIEYTNQSFRKPEQWNIGIFMEQDHFVRPLADRSEAYSFNQLRARLEEEYDNIKPGVSILFSAWGLLEDAPKSELDTFITYDPVTKAKTSTVVYPGSRIAFGFLAEEVISCRIIDDLDPRRFLKPEDQHTYQIKWGAFTENIPGSIFGQAYYTLNKAGAVYTENKAAMWNNRLTKKEIQEMLRQKPEFSRDKIPLNDFNFTLTYQEQDYFVEQGQTPAALLKKLERELKPGQILKISGIQARVNPGRYVTGLAQTLKNHTELDSKIQEADVLNALISGEIQQVLRLNLPVAEFEALRLKLEKTAGIWLQQGDLDLTPFAFELEVRDDDPKPVLPSNKKE